MKLCRGWLQMAGFGWVWCGVMVGKTWYRLQGNGMRHGLAGLGELSMGGMRGLRLLEVGRGWQGGVGWQGRSKVAVLVFVINNRGRGVGGPPAACLGRVRAVFNSLPPCRYLAEYAEGFVRLLRNGC